MSATRELRVTPLGSVKTRRQLWAYQDFVPLNVATILAGTGGIGKSTILSWLTAGLTTGMLEGDFYGKPVSVGFISGEDDLATTLVPRLKAAGANLDLVQDFSGVQSVDNDGNTWTSLPTIADDLKLLKAKLLEWGTKVLIIDPVMSIMSGDSIKASDVRRNLDPIAGLAAELGIAPILVMHFGKGQGNASDKVSGSHAFRDVARSVLLLAVDDETDQRVLTVDKSNYSQRSASLAFAVESATVPTDDGDIAVVGRARLIGETTLTVHEIVQRQAEDILGKDQSEIIDFVRRHKDGVQLADIVAEFDIPQANLRVYLSRFVRDQRIERISRGLYGPKVTSQPSVASITTVTRESDVTEVTMQHTEIPVAKVNGICPRCGNPSHWANAKRQYLHPECEDAA